MRIALVGGIYGKDGEFRQKLQVTPEMVLEKGLCDRGHKIATYGHYSTFNSKYFDVVHVHHLSYGAARMAVDEGNTAFTFTSHEGAAMTRRASSLSRQLAAKFVVSRADAVIALSTTEADFQKRHYPLAGAFHQVIPNGVDTATYYYNRRNSAATNRRSRLLYVGQLSAQKNVEVLLRAVTHVKQPVDLQLVYHNSTLEDPLRALASTLRLKERVQFLGPKSPRELAVLYQSADVFVLPSLAEALPSVVTEAMLCGTPVVATDVGGVREQLGGYGVCVTPGHTTELASAISHVLDNYDWFAAQSARASAYASERFSIARMVDHHLELYANLLERKGPRRRHSAVGAPVDALLRTGVNFICATK